MLSKNFLTCFKPSRRQFWSVIFISLLLTTGLCTKSKNSKKFKSKIADEPKEPSYTDSIIDVTKTFGKSVKDAASNAASSIKDTASNAASSIKDTASNAASSIKNTVTGSFSSNPLGPDTEQGSCDKDNCQEQSNGDKNKYRLKQEQLPIEEDSHDLSVVDEETESLFSQLSGVITSSVSTVVRTAKENIIDNGAKLVKNFSEAVRGIVSEELYTFLSTIMTGLGDSLLQPGSTLNSLGERAMTIALIILLLLFSYLLLFKVSLILILGFNASLFLLHHFFGPKWIFGCALDCGSYFTWLLGLMYTWPKTSALVLVMIFVYTVVWPYIRSWTVRRPEERVQDIETIVLDISQRLDRLETKQNEHFEEVRKSQREMLEILRQLNRQKQD